MSLIDYGHNAVADEIVREIMDGREPGFNDVLALAQEAVRLTQAVHEFLNGAPLDEQGRFKDARREALYRATKQHTSSTHKTAGSEA
jgi:hypothetical protein